MAYAQFRDIIKHHVHIVVETTQRTDNLQSTKPATSVIQARNKSNRHVVTSLSPLRMIQIFDPMQRSMSSGQENSVRLQSQGWHNTESEARTHQGEEVAQLALFVVPPC